MSLLSTSIPMPVSDQLLSAAEENSHTAIDMANTWSHSPQNLLGGNSNPGLWMMGAAERLLERTAENVYYADFAACNNFTDGNTLATKIQCPSLILAGNGDLMTPPAAARKIVDLIPDCSFKLIQNCGHAIMSEQPEIMLDELITIV